MRAGKYPIFLLSTGLLLTMLIYWPGLLGPWLVDDNHNLGHFWQHTPATAPYIELVFENISGPLGRSVSMTTFAVNHALGLFSPYALKATNLLFHLGNGLLLFALLRQLFQQRNPIEGVTPAMLAALLTCWWLLLPLHTSTVLYIVQRMTQIASLFSLLTCLTWALGRAAIQTGSLQKGRAWIAGSLLAFFPLAIFSKESAFGILPWLLLIELFFFNQASQRIKIRPVLTALLILTLLIGSLLATLPIITDGYVGRSFSLSERLLTEPRILWTYISDIFLPDNQRMGLFQDDYLISHSLTSPWTTVLAIAGLTGALFIAIWLSATRWWGVAFGILFYLAGHLIESTIIALELYFEHRNYLPSAGLLLAIATLVISHWPWQKRWLILTFTLYLGVLGFSTLQRSHIWGDKDLLLETSALNHPHSLRAWSDYTENLLITKGGRTALETALQGAKSNPEFAGISWLHMISIYCRLDSPPPPALLTASSQALGKLPPHYTTPLSVGLQNILENWQAGKCGKTDLGPIANAIPLLDENLRQHYGKHYGRYWVLRFTMSEWLLESGKPELALAWLHELWAQGDHKQRPTIGLALAQTLAKAGKTDAMLGVLTELDAVTADAPPDFLQEMNRLRQQAQETP